MMSRFTAQQKAAAEPSDEHTYIGVLDQAEVLELMGPNALEMLRRLKKILDRCRNRQTRQKAVAYLVVMYLRHNDDWGWQRALIVELLGEHGMPTDHAPPFWPDIEAALRGDDAP